MPPPHGNRSANYLEDASGRRRRRHRLSPSPFQQKGQRKMRGCFFGIMFDIANAFLAWSQKRVVSQSNPAVGNDRFCFDGENGTQLRDRPFSHHRRKAIDGSIIQRRNDRDLPSLFQQLGSVMLMSAIGSNIGKYSCTAPRMTSEVSFATFWS